VHPCVVVGIYFVTQVQLATGSLRSTPTPWVTTHSLDYFNICDLCKAFDCFLNAHTTSSVSASLVFRFFILSSVKELHICSFVTGPGRIGPLLFCKVDHTADYVRCSKLQTAHRSILLFLNASPHFLDGLLVHAGFYSWLTMFDCRSIALLPTSPLLSIQLK
jgi:hypothetical protein